MINSPISHERPTHRPLSLPETTFFQWSQNQLYLMGRHPDLSVIYPAPLTYLLFGGAGFLLMGGFLLILLLGERFYPSIPGSGTDTLFYGVVLLVIGAAFPIGKALNRWIAGRLINQRLQREGTILRGTLDGFLVKRADLEVEFRFESPKGRLIRARQPFEQGEWDGKVLPESGTPLYILCFNEKEFYLL